MTDHTEDRDLRAAFDALRRETIAGLAPFRLPRVAPARHAVRWHFRPLIATGLLAAAMVAVVVERRNAERERMMAPFLSSTTWTSPTDFLLATPGKELMSTVPTLGSSIIDTSSGTPQ